MTDIVDALYWDPFDVEIDANPYGVWQRLRDEAPLYRNDRYDFWALSRFADVEAASTAPKVFSSAHGTVLEIMSDQSLAAGQMIIFMDPPGHTRLRSLVSRAFTPRRMALLEDRVRDLAAGLLDPHVGSGSFDYVEDFAAILPSMVISSLLGVPDADRARVHHLIDTLFHIEPGVGMINDVSFGARIELFEYISGQLTDRSTTPRDDLLTDLVTAEVAEPDGSVRRLTLEESSEFALLLISAGTETVARLLGWAAMLLDEHPDQRADLVADTSLIPNAVEELLRFEAPSPVQGRWTTEPVELYGEVVPADSKVLLLTGSAGRDERKYPDADRFDIRRQFDHHVSFGYGVHFCLGAALARMEGRIGIEETLARFPEWTVDRARARRLHTSTVRGWTNVPVST
ncbi:MAG: cytochrome P450 [Acidimicrobiales bacterium]